LTAIGTAADPPSWETRASVIPSRMVRDFGEI
jgi:hypothetical protein